MGMHFSARFRIESGWSTSIATFWLANTAPLNIAGDKFAVLAVYHVLRSHHLFILNKVI